MCDCFDVARPLLLETSKEHNVLFGELLLPIGSLPIFNTISYASHLLGKMRFRGTHSI